MTMIAEPPARVPSEALPAGSAERVPSNIEMQLLTQPPEVLTTTFEGYPLWESAASVEAQVFIDCGYVESKEDLTREYAPYVARTTMMGLVIGEDVRGATRVSDRTEGVGKYGFKTLNDADAGRLILSASGLEIVEGLDLDRIQEVGTIAMEQELRELHALKLSGYLYEAIYNRGVAYGHTHTIASFDKKYFAGFRFHFRPAVVPLGPAVQYMGSPTVPAIIDHSLIDPAKFH